MSPIKRIDARSTALLIIDMQNSGFDPDSYTGKVYGSVFSVKLRRKLTTNIKKLAEVMRGAGATVIHVPTVFEPDYADFGYPERWRPPSGEPLNWVKGTPGAQIVDELTPQKGDYVVEAKCFDKFLYSPLELILRNKGIKTLIFTGTATSVCVETTLRSATGRGFEVILVSDTTAAPTREFHEVTIKGIAIFFGTVMKSEEVISLIGMRS